MPEKKSSVEEAKLTKSAQVVVPAPIPTPAKSAKAEVKTEAKTEAKKEGKGEEKLVLGQEYDEIIKRLSEMGFGRDESVKAMKCAFNNPDRATDYLVNVTLDVATNREYLQDSKRD